MQPRSRPPPCPRIGGHDEDLPGPATGAGRRRSPVQLLLPPQLRRTSGMPTPGGCAFCWRCTSRALTPTTSWPTAATPSRAYAQAEVCPDTPCRSDVFHAVAEVQKVVTKLENRAYQTLTTCVNLAKKQANFQKSNGRANGSYAKQLRRRHPKTRPGHRGGRRRRRTRTLAARRYCRGWPEQPAPTVWPCTTLSAWN